MRIEVLCTGDELLTGLTADTNSSFFMGKLFELGEKVQRVHLVGDVHADITEAILAASQRADAVLVSGGLGPTADDLTAEAAAAAAGVPLVEDAAVLEAIKARFARHGFAFTANNARQARVPSGAEVVINPVGSAPMFILRLGRCTLFFVAGVPREYKYLVEHEVLRRLKAMIEQQPGRVFRASRLLKTVGLAESHLDDAVAPIARAHPQVVFGFRTQSPENHLKLTAEAESQDAADRALATVEEACRRVLAPFLFGAGDDEFPALVGALLTLRRETVGVVDGCTGGLTAQLLAAPSGSSTYLAGALVVNRALLQARWVQVDLALLERSAGVSREAALAMAEGVRREAGTTYGVGLLGFVGPGGGSAADPVGTAYCALADSRGASCERHVFAGEPERIRSFAAYKAIEVLWRRLRSEQAR